MATLRRVKLNLLGVYASAQEVQEDSSKYSSLKRHTRKWYEYHFKPFIDKAKVQGVAVQEIESLGKRINRKIEGMVSEEIAKEKIDSVITDIQGLTALLEKLEFKG